jgi:hypothetical protein
MRSFSIKRIDQLVDMAIGHWVQTLKTRTKPSAWGQLSYGWQEHWDSTLAGFYATADAFWLARRVEQLYPRLRLKGLNNRVFRGHLEKTLDRGLPARTVDQAALRRRAMAVSMKLAKFLQAAAWMAIQERDGAIVGDVCASLSRAELEKSGRWPAVIDGRARRRRKASKSALVEISIGLAAINRARSSRMVERALRRICQELTRERDSAWKAIWCWALTESVLLGASRSTSILNALRRGVAEIRIPEKEEFADEFFTFGRQEPGEYYHFSVRPLSALAIINASRLIAIADESLLPAIATVEELALEILKSGELVNSTKPYFWNSAQTVNLLIGFKQLISERKELRMTTFIAATPRVFTARDFKVDAKSVFVIMPFGPEWSTDVFNVIRTGLRQLKLEAHRSDEIFDDGSIVEQIWNMINRANYVVADLTGRNPNVFYELGIAHTLGKQVYMCAQDRRDIPFDVTILRSMEYGEPIPKNLSALRRNLVATVGAWQKGKKTPKSLK